VRLREICREKKVVNPYPTFSLARLKTKPTSNEEKSEFQGENWLLILRNEFAITQLEISVLACTIACCTFFSAVRNLSSNFA
jgi:hypothetical protein